MNFAIKTEPILTELDHARLRALMRRSEVPEHIEDLLDRAAITPSRAVQADVVTMRSKVRLAEESGQTRTIEICWPQDARAEAGLISVLSPLGAALLGRSAGAQVVWAGADGKQHRAKIDAVLFQPEASGDYTT